MRKAAGILRLLAPLEQALEELSTRIPATGVSATIMMLLENSQENIPRDLDNLREILRDINLEARGGSNVSAAAAAPTTPGGSRMGISSGGARFVSTREAEQQQPRYSMGSVAQQQEREQPNDWMSSRGGATGSIRDFEPSDQRGEESSLGGVEDPLREQPEDWFAARNKPAAAAPVVSSYTPPAPVAAAPASFVRRSAPAQAEPVASKLSAGAFKRRSSTSTPMTDQLAAGVDPHDWKSAMKLGKLRAQEAKLNAEKSEAEAEAAKWANVPGWKRGVIEDKQRKRYEKETPAREAETRRLAKLARFNALPTWKQELLIKQGKVDFDD